MTLRCVSNVHPLSRTPNTVLAHNFFCVICGYGFQQWRRILSYQNKCTLFIYLFVKLPFDLSRIVAYLKLNVEALFSQKIWGLKRKWLSYKHSLKCSELVFQISFEVQYSIRISHRYQYYKVIGCLYVCYISHPKYLDRFGRYFLCDPSWSGEDFFRSRIRVFRKRWRANVNTILWIYGFSILKGLQHLRNFINLDKRSSYNSILIL